MTIPLRNVIYDKIRDAGHTTDVELDKAVKKEDIVISEDRFNKMLLDLEIMGLIKTTWLTKDTRRIEAVSENEDQEDEVDAQNREAMERDYEASFPGTENE